MVQIPKGCRSCRVQDQTKVSHDRVLARSAPMVVGPQSVGFAHGTAVPHSVVTQMVVGPQSVSLARGTASFLYLSHASSSERYLWI